MFFILLTTGLAAILMSDSGSTLVIRDNKVSGDVDMPRDIWAIKWGTYIGHMDVNGDGKLDKNEFMNMTAARVGAITQSKEKEDKIKAFLEENWVEWWEGFMNDKHLESISADDFISTESETREKMEDNDHMVIEVKWILTFFEVVDADENDSLNKTEYANFLKIFRTSFYSNIFSEIDTDSNGALSKIEMITNNLSWVKSNNFKSVDMYGKIV